MNRYAKLARRGPWRLRLWTVGLLLRTRLHTMWMSGQALRAKWNGGASETGERSEARVAVELRSSRTVRESRCRSRACRRVSRIDQISMAADRQDLHLLDDDAFHGARNQLRCTPPARQGT